MTTRPTAAPAHWPYYEHRTCAEVAQDERAPLGAGYHRPLLAAEEIERRRVDNSICFRCGARADIDCGHRTPIHHRSTSPRCEPAAVSKPPAAGEFTAVRQ